MANITYNRIIRKLTVAFGDLFNNITLVRYNQDLTEQERFLVPIAYASKEMYVMRLQGDPDLDKKVQMTLPRMSYILNGITYDSSRKLNTNQKKFASTSTGATISQYNPVPYNFDFSLYLYVRNIEDGNQVIERILPFFTPDYTIKLNLIPEMGVVKEVPIILNNIDYSVQDEGNRESNPRIVIWTLNFTVHGYIFGATSPVNIIRNSITNILSGVSEYDEVVFNMSASGIGPYTDGEIVYQGYSLQTATATAKVSNYSNNTLTVTDIQGNFVSSMPIYGAQSRAQYTFTSYSVVPKKLAQIIITPVPLDANVNSPYTLLTTIIETPDIINEPIVTAYDVFGDLGDNQFGSIDLSD